MSPLPFVLIDGMFLCISGMTWCLASDEDDWPSCCHIQTPFSESLLTAPPSRTQCHRPAHLHATINIHRQTDRHTDKQTDRHHITVIINRQPCRLLIISWTIYWTNWQITSIDDDYNAYWPSLRVLLHCLSWSRFSLVFTRHHVVERSLSATIRSCSAVLCVWLYAVSQSHAE